MIPLQTDRPLAFFDIESTGTNVRSDRIIDLAIVKLLANGQREEHTFRVNPERPIPAEASAVHGIYDQDVKDSPTFKQVAAKVAQVFEGCDLGGYNILRFDIPMLCEEFTRAGVTFIVEGRRVVDPQRIFHQREPRDLTAALNFYCGEMHLGAHGALDDVVATIQVLEGQYKKYSDLPKDINALNDYCNPRDPTWADASGKLKWVAGELTINFGSKQGAKLRDLAQKDPGYLRWILDKNFPRDTTEIVGNALKGKYPTPPAAGSNP